MRVAAKGNTAARRAAITVSIRNGGPGRYPGIGWAGVKGCQGLVLRNAALRLLFIGLTIQTLIIPLQYRMHQAR